MNKALQDRYTQLSADADGWTAEKHGNTRGSLGQQSRDEVLHKQKSPGTMEVPGTTRPWRDYADESDDSEGWEDWYIV